MKCKVCGNEQKEIDKFCTNCGTSITNNSEVKKENSGVNNRGMHEVLNILLIFTIVYMLPGVFDTIFLWIEMLEYIGFNI